jgi:DNA-binding transcriptional ArsR family regulator
MAVGYGPCPLPRGRTSEGPSPYSQALLRLVPRVGPVIAQLRNELHERNERRYEEFRTAVEEDIDLEELAELLLENERFGDLLRDSVEAALRTRDEQKIRLLAKSFVSGALAEDEAAVDEAEQQTRLIAELDPVDLRAMLALRDRSRGYGHPVGCLRKELGVTPTTANLIYARLQRNGLVEIEPMASFDPKNDSGEVELDESWGLSDTTTAILQLMDELASDSQ